MQANEEFVILRTFLASHSTQESSKLYLNDDKHRYVTKLDHHMGKISKYMNPGKLQDTGLIYRNWVGCLIC